MALTVRQQSLRHRMGGGEVLMHRFDAVAVKMGHQIGDRPRGAFSDRQNTDPAFGLKQTQAV